MKTKLAFLVVVIFAAAALYQNCGQEPSLLAPDPSASKRDQQSAADLETLKDEITKTAVLNCVAASDCEALPIGAKACGGPSGYVVVSAKQTDMHRLNELVSSFTRREDERNLAGGQDGSGLVSNCMQLMPPEIDCIENRCQVVPNP